MHPYRRQALLRQAPPQDVELCLLCRQKLSSPHLSTRYGRVLVWICRIRWFTFRVCKEGWAGEPTHLDAFPFEIKLYNGDVLTAHEIGKVVFVEGVRLIGTRHFPLHVINMVALIFQLASVDYGTSPEYAADAIRLRAEMDPAFGAVYGKYGWNVLVRFPELRLTLDLIVGLLASYSPNESDSPGVIFLLIFLNVFLFYITSITWRFHCERAERRLVVFLIAGRILHALIGASRLFVLISTNALVYLTVVTLVVLHANKQANNGRRNE
jgi:hypothetical protein